MSADREVATHLADKDACKAWLEKLVSKPRLALRQTRLPAARRVASVDAAGQDVAAVEPMVVLTWNANQKVHPTSAEAPADAGVWTAADNLKSVQAEVLRWRPDVLSLRESAGA
jgi:hypothetical protein